MPQEFECYRVLIEFKRVQTYLFAVPRLKTMLGANAILGEVLRIELPTSAVEHGAALPPGIQVPFKSSGAATTNDPLGSPMNPRGGEWVPDEPQRAYARGVLTRDGGHFQALFPTQTCATSFTNGAAVLLAERLPGLMVDVRIEAWFPEREDSRLAMGWKPLEIEPDSAGRALFEPPGMSICQLSGQGLATQKIREPGSTEDTGVCSAVKVQWDGGQRFQDGRSRDIVGLLQRPSADEQPLLPCVGNGWQAPQDLESLAGGEGRYLALIHADGNSVGRRTQQLMDKSGGHMAKLPDDSRERFMAWLQTEAEIEAFFHSMRSSVRIALIAALNKTFEEQHNAGPSKFPNRTRPYQLLMVGGDDLLLLCRAGAAIDFVRHYAGELASLPLSDERPLGIGAGIVCCQPTLPFHAMRSLAEELASSAKRLARADCTCSVADWQVVTNSQALGVAEHRRTHDLIRYQLADGSQETLVLSAKPYRVLHAPTGDPGSGSLASIEGLHKAATRIADKQVARSQRKNLPALIRRGRRAADFAFEDLPDDMKRVLGELGIKSVWKELDRCVFMTRLIDLFEVIEIPDLGRRELCPRHPAASTKGATA